VSRQVGAVLAAWRYLAWVLGAVYTGVCVLTLTGLYLLRRKQRALVELARARAQDAREQAERLELALAGGSLGLIDMDLSSGIRRVNAQAQAIVGMGPDDPVDTMSQWADRIHPDDWPSAHQSRLAHEQGETEAMDIEYRVRHKGGHWVWVHSRGRVTLRDAGGTPLRLVGTYQDISERKTAQALIAELAFYDPLTHLPNRRLLMDRLSQVQRASARHGRPAAVLFLDLDRFKWVNDTLGHDMGDLLLQEVAKRLQACLRKSDTVSRLGGDEFVLLLDQLGDTPHAAQAHATRAAEKVLSALSVPVRLGETAHQVTVSIGIALFVGEAKTPAQVLKDADQALYLAKGAGRNQAAVYAVPPA
jgi:diguanylate cyclase (GGDEF)-like protein/PAS domain S-box-containing protein